MNQAFRLHTNGDIGLQVSTWSFSSYKPPKTWRYRYLYGDEKLRSWHLETVQKHRDVSVCMGWKASFLSYRCWCKPKVAPSSMPSWLQYTVVIERPEKRSKTRLNSGTSQAKTRHPGIKVQARGIERYVVCSRQLFAPSPLALVSWLVISFCT